MSVVTTEGDLSAEQCNFTGSNDAGLVCVGPSNALVVDCSFYNNEEDGVRVCEGATLIVKSSRMYNNGRDGLRLFETKTSKCIAINCDIDYNYDVGISMLDSTDVTLICNSIFGNEFGIFMVNSEANISENNVFDNDLWGIWSMSNSWCDIAMNKIFRNKAGGVRMGYRAAGKEFPPSVIEQNKIYDNIGPGFVENVQIDEVHPLSLGKSIDLMKSHFKSPNSLKSAKFQDNEEHNNKENENGDKLNLSVSYCSNCRLSTKTPKICQKCFTTAYCGKICKRNHRPKHETICKVLRKKSSYLITSMERVEYYITEQLEGRKEIGPNDSVRPLRKGRRFDVKVHTVVIEESFSLVLCDRSRQLHERFDSKVIKELVKEFGVLCERKGIEKKLFFHCLLEDNGQLRLFTNTFPKFQSW
ncbi:Hypothetical predicted protein [Paramuricea clavata]|uniref:Uncharacterized protein n=1 Tax=Paramuricea clavata TaxID=317549 RepID=A0A7D9J3C2_PARCT|nr:Hypothetical predicted protein [Paramuricea clavata]